MTLCLMELCDAHCHYQFAEVPYAAVEQARADGVGPAMINGSAPVDWPDVEALGARDPRNLMAFGLHPWDVPTAPVGWVEQLRAILLKYPSASLGEMGLDRWVAGHDPVAQEQAFLAQLALAVELERPLTIHCVRAIGPLLELLRREPLPSRGFLLHSWNGPAELVPELVQRGAYFSFSAHHLVPRKADLRGQFAGLIPAERVLIETDAPALCPTPEYRLRELPAAADGTEANHPANLVRINQELAGLRGLTAAAMAAQTAENFRRLFIGAE